MNEKIFDKRQKNHRVLRRLVMAGNLLAGRARRSKPPDTNLAEVWDRAVEELRASVSDDARHGGYQPRHTNGVVLDPPKEE